MTVKRMDPVGVVRHRVPPMRAMRRPTPEVFVTSLSRSRAFDDVVARLLARGAELAGPVTQYEMIVELAEAIGS